MGYGRMVLVQQVRVIRNVVWLGVLCLLALALVRARLWEHREALGLGWVVGGLYGWLRWGQLRRNIARATGATKAIKSLYSISASLSWLLAQ
jgi:hypothetical protein